MSLLDYLVLGTVAAAIIFNVSFIIRQKRRGKSGCGCKCGDCGSTCPLRRSA